MTQRQLQHHGRQLVQLVAERAGSDAIATAFFNDIFPGNINDIMGIECQPAIDHLRRRVTTSYIRYHCFTASLFTLLLTFARLFSSGASRSTGREMLTTICTQQRRKRQQCAST